MSPNALNQRFFATCAPGFEALLHEEAKALKLPGIERQTGGVSFEGTLQEAWRANLELRTAIRVLMQVARFPAANADELRAGMGSIDWRRFVRPDGSLLVKARSTESAIDHTLFAAQCAKDGIVDQLRTQSGARPSVDKEDPDLRVQVHLVRDRCRVLVDTSGESLHKRGWRKFQGRAPLAETLAAGVVLLSGWDRRAPLLDPFCGSGTILIEAALIASGTAPGLLRAQFGFERWPGHDAQGWQKVRDAARARARFPGKLALWGGDRDPNVIAGAQENLAAAGLGERVQIEVADALEFAPRPGWNAWIVSNLPYGERVGDTAKLAPMLRSFGAVLRERCRGYRAALLSGDPALSAALALPSPRRVALKNGGLDCELLMAEL